MKTKEELLKFYGVEIGKKYKITKTDFGYENFYGKILEIEESPRSLEKIVIKIDGGEFSLTAQYFLSILDYEEVKPPILDDEEREFLQKYVMNNPALKGKVAYITKTPLRSKKTEYIEITTTKYDDDFACFPCFEQGTMYKGMEIGKNYTPKELGLEE